MDISWSEKFFMRCVMPLLFVGLFKLVQLLITLRKPHDAIVDEAYKQVAAEAEGELDAARVVEMTSKMGLLMTEEEVEAEMHGAYDLDFI